MIMKHTDESMHRRPLRLWPGVVIAALLVLVRYAAPVALPDASLFDMPLTMFAVMGGLAGALAVVAWWLFFSRAPWPDRLGAVALIAAALAATPRILHESISGGMMGMMFFLYAIPALAVAFVVWAVASRGLSDRARRASMAVTILLACGAWSLVRTEGVRGDGSDFRWRWTMTAEERLLGQARDIDLPPAAAPAERPAEPNAAEPGAEPPAPAAAPTPAAVTLPEVPAAATEPDWPGFRGPARDSSIRGIRIETDWTKSPPVELWRRPVGPGWSSFAVDGDLLYTQEQRGDDEIVAAYKVSTGEPVWGHRDPVRFYESNGGAGPRATPALSNGRVYTLGATGIVNSLDAGSGALVWSRNAAADAGVEVPGWGFAGSPLVVDDLVIVAASGALVAYDIATGTPRWTLESGGGGYSSAHPATIDGVPQILLLRGAGATSVVPASGTVLWEHAWPGAPILQPALMRDGDVLISTVDMAGGLGIRRLAVARGPAGWTVEERWTSRGLKPYFNDYVVNDGHAFGFDGAILSCIDLEDGARKWKGGRYGQGQLVLLAEQDVMLVLSEDGELALVRATPERFVELARAPALDAKTWNHPVLIGNVLLVRNGEEMAAFRLAVASR